MINSTATTCQIVITIIKIILKIIIGSPAKSSATHLSRPLLADGSTAGVARCAVRAAAWVNLQMTICEEYEEYDNDKLQVVLYVQIPGSTWQCDCHWTN